MFTSLPRSIRVPAATLAATASLSLAACGGGSSGGPGGGTLDRDALAKQLTSICTDAAAKVQAIDKPSDPGNIGPYLAKVAPVTQDVVDKIAALRPAPEVEADYDTLMAGERDAAAALDKAQGSADPLSAVAATAKRAPQLKAAAERIGVTSCGE